VIGVPGLVEEVAQEQVASVLLVETKVIVVWAVKDPAGSIRIGSDGVRGFVGA
jgi:hypothetical protein